RFLQRSGDEALKERMGAVGTGLELGVELDADIEIPVGDLDRLDQPPVGGADGYGQACVFNLLAEMDIELVPLSVVFADRRLTLSLEYLTPRVDDAGVAPQAHRAAFGEVHLLVEHQVDDAVGVFGGELAGVGASKSAGVAGVFDDGDLH